MEKAGLKDQVEVIHCKAMLQKEMVGTYLAVKDNKKAKALLIDIKDLYTAAQRIPNADQEVVNRIHLLLTNSYYDYFQATRDYKRAIRNGVLFLKYALKYNRYGTVTWIGIALNVFDLCIRVRGFAQSFHLIEAFKVLIKKFREIKCGKNEYNPQKEEIETFYDGLVKMSYIRHLAALFETGAKNAKGLNKDKVQLTPLTDCIFFEDLEIDPNKDKHLHRLPSTDFDFRYLYDQMNKAHDQVKGLIANKYQLDAINDIIQKVKQYKQYFTFLID